MTVTPTPVSHASGRAFCQAILPHVSRTFAICIPLLPATVEYATLVAYLLCRVADTIEDAVGLSPTEKSRLLEHWSACLADASADAAPLHEAFPSPVTPDEDLVARAAEVLQEFHRLPATRRDAIRPWVQEMCHGMAEFVHPRARTAPGEMGGLATVEDLDRYTYYVAGTVGHLLTELFRAAGGRIGAPRYRRLKALATSFGRGLQLTNIIKDVADDRRRGWTFVPRRLCQLAGIRPEDLQDERHRGEARRVMLTLIDKAKRHLSDALTYSVTIPRRLYGVRLFCLTSLYFAVRTLRLAESDPRLLDPDHKVKIARSQVRRTMMITRLVAPSDLLVRAYFRSLAGRGWPAPTVSLAG